MIIDILTLFPKFYESPISIGLINNAINEQKIHLNIVDMRAYGEGNYKKCDDYTYGGGPGMIMTYNIFKKYFDSHDKGHTLIFSPSGKTLTQNKVKELSRLKLENFLRINVGRIEEVLIEKRLDKSTGKYKGVTRNYLNVIINTEEKGLFNTLAKVTIMGVKDGKLAADLIS